MLRAIALAICIAASPLASAVQLNDAIAFLTEFPEHVEQVQCLTKAIYFESRGEPLSGQRAVAHVAINRVVSHAFPRDVCAVVQFQRNGVCAFSWVCDEPEVRNPAAYDRAMRLAVQVYNERLIAGLNTDNTRGSTHFHNDTIDEVPWAGYKKTVVIGRHTFYKRSRG